MEGMVVVSQQQWEEELKESRKALDESALPVWDELKDLRHAGVAADCRGQVKCDELKERLKVVEQQSNDKVFARRKKLEQMAVCETEMAKASKDLDQLKDWIIRLSEWRDKREKFIAEDLQALEAIAETARKNSAKMQVQRAHIAWYQDLFGVRCEYSTGIKFIFTNIDPYEMDREFTITVHHDEHADKYSLLDCLPPLRAAQELLDKLNMTNKFFEFVRRVRKEFQSLVLCRA